MFLSSDVDGDDKAIALAMAGRGPPGQGKGDDSSSSSVVADSLPASDLDDSDMEVRGGWDDGQLEWVFW